MEDKGMVDLEKVFSENEDKFLEFDECTEKPSGRADICAFIILDRLIPGTCDMVCSAEHDEIWLVTDPDEIAEVATEADVINLIRCGVRYDGDTGSFAMYV
jgi:hypothetical protein